MKSVSGQWALVVAAWAAPLVFAWGVSGAETPPEKPAAAPTTAAEHLLEARRLASQGKLTEAIAEADRGLELDDKHLETLALRAELCESAGALDRAVADYNRLLELVPNAATLYDRRGNVRFKQADIKGAIADFDAFLAQHPDREPHHWRRGIAYYYAGEFDAGQKQFEGYQTVDDNDVENVTWRMLCMARGKDFDTARQAMPPVRQDRRVPMMEIDALFRGTGSAEDVMRAATAGDPPQQALNEQLFYAHLYTGLYHAARGETEQALRHIHEAVEKHKVDHYMWHVGRVHLELAEERGQE